MTIRYVGPGGSDVADGLSWANRKLTLNGVEDTPVVAGDTVYVGPGTYRETLTCDVSGSDGSPITYIGDIFGVNTDGVGGEVRITGSDDDLAQDRGWCIRLASAKNYRTFRGFRMDICQTAIEVTGTASKGLIVEDTSFVGCYWPFYYTTSGTAAPGPILRRCIFIHSGSTAMDLRNNNRSIDLSLENCIFYGAMGAAIEAITGSVWGITAKNCTFFSTNRQFGDFASVEMDSSGNASYVYNSVIYHGSLRAGTLGDIVEDYCYYVPGSSDAATRVNVTKGANSITRSYIDQPPFLFDGFYFPKQTLDFSPLSPINLYGCGQNPPSDDFYGLPRPTADSKKTRGAIQYMAIERETTTVPSGETESIKMPDAAAYQISIPITGNRMKFTVKVYREANYAGTNPQLTIKQPGQDDVTVTDTGSAGTWNTLSVSVNPASAPTFVVMQIRNDNTATSGSYATYWGAFEAR